MIIYIITYIYTYIMLLWFNYKWLNSMVYGVYIYITLYLMVLTKQLRTGGLHPVTANHVFLQWENHLWKITIVI